MKEMEIEFERKELSDRIRERQKKNENYGNARAGSPGSASN
jgi:hypothetical protein